MSAGRSSHSCGSGTMFLPIRPAFLGCCLRARTACHRNVRGLFAELSTHLQRPKGKHTCSDLPPPPNPVRLSPSTWGEWCYLGRVHMDKTHMKEVGLPTLLFPAAKIALFIAMYRVSWWGGEECSIHNASASSCLVYFFPVCGKSLIVLFLIALSSILLSHQVLLFSPCILPLQPVRLWRSSLQLSPLPMTVT